MSERASEEYNLQMAANVGLAQRDGVPQEFITRVLMTIGLLNCTRSAPSTLPELRKWHRQLAIIIERIEHTPVAAALTGDKK